MLYADSFRVACIVDTDLREYTQYVKPKQGPKGLYYDVDFEIVLSFGTTEEIKAEIAWNQEVSIVCIVNSSVYSCP